MKAIAPEIGFLIWATLSLVALTLMLTAIFSLLQSKSTDWKAKIVWLIGIIFLPILGPIAYFQYKRKTFQES